MTTTEEQKRNNDNLEIQKDFKDSEFAGKEHYRSKMIKIYRSLGMKKSDT